MFASSVVFTSQPLDAFPSQSLKPAVQVVMTHLDATQLSVALFVLQASPHPPQFFGSSVVLTSQPFAAFPSQLAVPATVQVDTVQAAFVQTSEAPVPEHTCPHDPQLLALLSRSISQPFEARPSQLP